MEPYEQGRRNIDGAMRALSRVIDREPKALVARSHVKLDQVVTRRAADYRHSMSYMSYILWVDH
jgi:hypothetical protein